MKTTRDGPRWFRFPTENASLKIISKKAGEKPGFWQSNGCCQVKIMVDCFNFERNDSCPCGSGKKYKKCCMGYIEDCYNKIRELDFEWVQPKFAQALAFVCGLKPLGNDYIPSIDDVENGLKVLDQNLLASPGSKDNKEVMDYVNELSGAFVKLLNEDDYFKNLRFSFAR